MIHNLKSYTIGCQLDLKVQVHHHPSRIIISDEYDSDGPALDSDVNQVSTCRQRHNHGRLRVGVFTWQAPQSWQTQSLGWSRCRRPRPGRRPDS